jgi:FdhD protein
MSKNSATSPIRYLSIDGSTAHEIEGEIVDEGLACFSVNGAELATFMCTPANLDKLALGFLFNEGIISTLDDVRQIHVSDSTTCVDVWLHDASFTVPTRAIVTSGCGGGVTFDDLSAKHEPLVSGLRVKPEQLSDLMREMLLGAHSYKRARGIHTAALANADRILLQVEDVGRHNCLDKLAGAALQLKMETNDSILLSSGRISSEMINKARRLGAPIICSRTSPTSLSVALAKKWNMTIVAYLRQRRMRIYSHPQRVLDESLLEERLASGENNE